MQAPTIGTPTAAYSDTIFVAIELSQKTWLVTVHSPDLGRMSRYKVEGGDHAGLLGADRQDPGAGGAEARIGAARGELLRGRL